MPYLSMCVCVLISVLLPFTGLGMGTDDVENMGNDFVRGDMTVGL